MKLVGNSQPNSQFSLHLLLICLSLFVGIFLAGCGASSSGGDSDPEPDLPTLTVAVNYIEQDNCPETTAYVTVLDEGNQPILDLTSDQFYIDENDTEINPVTFTEPGGEQEPITVAILMDHSSDIVFDETDPVTKMKNDTKTFVGWIETNAQDYALKIIKFAELSEQMNSVYTSNTSELNTAIDGFFSNEKVEVGGNGTASYIYKSIKDTIEDIKKENENLPIGEPKRKLSIILLSDGDDNEPNPNPHEPPETPNTTIEDAIRLAIDNNIPVFVVGVTTGVKKKKLNRLANETGGIFFSDTLAGNHQAIYEKISNLIMSQHYKLTYDSNTSEAYKLKITVIDNDEYGEGSKDLIPCN